MNKIYVFLAMLAVSFSAFAGVDLEAIAGSIENFGTSLGVLESSTVILVVGFVVDFILKKFPTKNPAGVIHAAAKILKGIRAILNAVISVIEKLADFLDKVVKQNIKEETKTEKI